MTEQRAHEARHAEVDPVGPDVGAVEQIEQRRVEIDDHLRPERAQRPCRCDRALERIEGEHEVARTGTQHPTHIGRTGILAADLKDVHALRARDEVAEGQRAQQIPDKRSEDEGGEHRGEKTVV